MWVNRKSAFTSFWLAALILSGWLYYNYQIDPELMGVVETRLHNVGAQEDGRIIEFLVQVGDHVQPGQIMARMDISDIEAEKRSLQEERESLEAAIAADRSRFRKEYDYLMLQIESRTAYLREKDSELKALSDEMSALEKEIQRIQTAEASGLGTDSNLIDLVARRDFLKRFIREQGKYEPEHSNEVLRNVQSRRSEDERDADIVGLSMLADRMERLEDVKRLSVLADERIRKRTVIAPADGYVSKLVVQIGDTVEAFLPVIAIEESKSEFVELYMNEFNDDKINVGYAVELYSKRARDYDAKGIITFIHPGFTPMPLRFMMYNQVPWGRKIRVKLQNGHKLMPGEVVRAHIVGPSEEMGVILPKADAAVVKTPLKAAESSPVLQKIHIPQSLKEKSRFEPSGLIWLHDIQRYLIVSDDTGFKGDNNHAPWLFLMDKNGIMDSEPLTLDGIEKLNDLEAVTMSDDGRIYLLSSQSINKKGKRAKTRQYLLEVEHAGREFKVIRKVELYKALTSSYDDAALTFLGLGASIGKAGRVLNIEGAAWYRGDLMLGLKEPQSAKGAIVWRLKNLEQFMASGRLQKDQLERYAEVAFNAADGAARGISDLCFDEKGNLYILSTIPKQSAAAQTSMLHAIDNFSAGLHQARLIKKFEGHKAEGIALYSDRHFTVVFDADSGEPHYLSWEKN